MSGDDCITREELNEEIAEMRESVQDDMRAYRRNRVEPELSEIAEQLDALSDRLSAFQERFDAVVSPADGEPSSHEQRVLAVREMMRTVAQTREHGTVGWKYSQIQDQLESNGHGRVHPPQAYRIMEDVGEAEGYAHATNDSDEQVLRCSLDALGSEGAVNDVNNAMTEAATDGGRKQRSDGSE